MRRLLHLVSLALLLVSCAGKQRMNPLPAELVEEAEIPGVPKARIWGDALPEYYQARFGLDVEELKDEHTAIQGTRHTYLAISGGGADGAFGAGLLCGWTEAGDRPEFTLVSGISTGSLIAPFAFLGSEYDDRLEEIYTSFSTDDLARERPLHQILTGDGAADTRPLAEKIREYYTQDMLDAIARETRRGRSLLIGTTNLDAQRSVIWNIGRIAESDAPNRLQLFHDVILASTAIPAAFPPVYFEVEARGERYDEMHVDGGATSQVFLYPIGFDWDRLLELLGVPGRPELYLIRNAKLSAPYDVMKPRTLNIAGVTISSLMRTSGLGDLYRTYVAAERDGLEFHLAAIPEDFDVVPQEPFDREYMQALFERARERASRGYPWENAPPGVDADMDGRP